MLFSQNMDSSVFSKWSSEHRELVSPFLYALKKDIALKLKKPRHLVRRGELCKFSV